MADSDWKKRVGVDVNYSPGQSSDEDELDSSSETKKWKALDSISAEYDHLATTPPRTRIRNKEKQKYYGDDGSHVISPRFHRVVRRNTTENIVLNEPNPSQESFAVKRTKRRSLKYTRGYERDLKLDIDRCRESRNESMPTTYQVFDFLKEVESSNRFKSLYSQPVNYISESKNVFESNSEVSSSDRVLDNRAEFHSYFCLSIRMGNSEKKQKNAAKEQTCKRTVQAEKQVWKNQLKDLIWLEVTAHKAGRTDTQQDAYLLSHRESVPSLLDKILDFKFINNEKKCSHSGVWTTQISVSSPDSGYVNFEETGTFNEPAPYEECLCVDCSVCSMTVGRAMLEVKQLLDALSEAESLFSSTREMATHHSVINTDEFTNKTKAMCLWYNMVHHQRLKILIIKKLLYKHRWKTSTNKKENEIKTQYENEKTTRDSSKLHQVKFNLENDNEKSEITTNNDNETDDLNQTQIQIEITETHANDLNSKNYDTVDSGHESIKSFDTKIDSHAEKSCLSVKSTNGMKEENTTIIEENLDTLNSELSKSPYESADSTTGSTNSNESGIAPSVIENQEDGTNIYDREEFNVFNMGPLGDLTKLRLYNPKLISPYRDYIEKMLKVRGLRRALYFLEKLHLCVLKKAKMTLEKYDEEILNEDIQLRNEENLDSSDDDFEYERHTRCEVDIQELKRECIELRRFGAWSKETLDMHLPSYRSAFLFLSTVPMENIHEFLTMRLEAKPEKPSALSIKQCIHELREGLAIAVRLRGRFTTHIYTALFAEPEDSKHRKFYDKVLSTFDTTLNEFYKLYLSYLSEWSGMEYLPRATLTAEWTFNSYLAQRLRPAATIAPLTFCCLTVRQLEGAANRLKNRVKELREKAESIKKGDESNSSIKLRILGVCRDLQCLLSEEREKALSTAQFARTVSTNLHHNSVFRDYRQKIYKAMASVQSILCWTIDQMQQATAPERLLELEESDRPSVQSRTREIVSQGYKFGFAFHREMCRLINDDISPEGGHNSCTRNSLSMCRQSRLVRTDSINYDNIQASMEDNYFSFNAFTPTSNNEFIYSTENPKSYERLKSKDEEALSLSLYGRKEFRKRQNSSTRSRRSPKFTPFDDIKELSELKPEDFQNGIPGCETCCRVPMYNETENISVKRTIGEKSSTCDWELMVSRGLVQFAKQWMEFALKRCERGRGLRPRWASHGLEFLMLTCDPQHTKHLTDREFKELKSMMDGCISHVIGSSQGANNNAMTPTIGTPPPQRARTSPLYNQQLSSIILPSTPPSTPLIELGTDSHNFSEDAESALQHKRLKALKELDRRRDEDLHRSGVIGYVRQETGARHHFRPRPVTFKWQRGIKIGQGRFGKVYTVVNTESGQLMAMKEVSLSVGDRQSVDRAANELKVLEGVVHPNLVQYYGVEIHREEMLIFMELCVEGSLESMIAGCSNTADGVNTNGLPEQLIRRYTGQLVSAIRALHDRSIAHRDVKSGNIFLTEGGNCLKLGDFGCAVKIRANTTVPGELQGYVGTQAYMAPEVFMKPSGHGRAADIWSLGCVVVEMASGKHPWSDCDSNYQIMFVVGMGNIPKIPSSLSAEGEDFCLACLQHDPTVRASAEKLEHHHFLKVNHNEYY